MGRVAGEAEFPRYFWDDAPEEMLRVVRELGLVEREEYVEKGAGVRFYAAPWVVDIVRNFRHGGNERAGILGLRRGASDPEWLTAFEAAESLSRIGGAEMVWALEEEETERERAAQGGQSCPGDHPSDPSASAP